MRISVRFANKNLRFCRANVEDFSITKPKLSVDSKYVIQPTILLTNAFSETTNILIDHIWIIVTENIMKCDFRIGDIISFTGKASYYNKQRNNNYPILDLGLTDIKKVKFNCKNKTDASLVNFMKYCMNMDDIILPDVYQKYVNSNISKDLSDADLKEMFGTINKLLYNMHIYY